MGLVISTCFTIGFILILCWLYSLYKSYLADRIELRKQENEQALKEELERKERLLYQEGVMLHCMNCGTAFPGPLTDMGCPECHISSLVITEEEFLQSKTENINII